MTAVTQYGTSIVYPFSAMGAHVSAVPNHQVGRITSFEMRCNVALAGQFGFELDLNKCTEEELKTAEKAIKTYRELGEVFHRGDCYRLKSPFDSDVCAIEFISEDKNTVILTLNSSRATAYAPDEYILLEGLDENALYALDGSDKRFGGDYLMNIGWHFVNDRENQSITAVFKKI